VRARIVASALPAFAGVLDLLARGIAPGGTRANAREHAAFTTFDPTIGEALRLLASDAQTSGGLLIAIDPSRVDALCERLREGGDLAARIGSLETGEGIALDP
jgi:selenide,water dikinase